MINRETKYEDLVDGDWVSLCDNLWELLTGIFLDVRTPLEKMYKVISNLKARGLLDYRSLRAYGGRYGSSTDEGMKRISQALKDAGYIWHNQKARCFRDRIKFDLATATYEQIKSLWGIGDKLACMWMTIVHQSNDYPIIDTHVLQYLRSKGYMSTDYNSLSEAFKKEAEKNNMTVRELDLLILTNGIKKRRGF